MVIEFKKELFYGDLITVFVTAQTLAVLDLMFITKLKNKDESIVAAAKTGMVCYDYTSKKIATVPASA